MRKNRKSIKILAFTAAAALFIGSLFPLNSYADEIIENSTETVENNSEIGSEGVNTNGNDTSGEGGNTNGDDGMNEVGNTSGDDAGNESVSTNGDDAVMEDVNTGGDNAGTEGGNTSGDGAGNEDGNTNGFNAGGDDENTGRGDATEGLTPGNTDLLENGQTEIVPEISLVFNEAYTRFDLVLSGYDAAEGEFLRGAIWSEAGGQDDLEWVGLTKQADGTYKKAVNISDFSDPGIFDIHVYKYSADGTAAYLTGISADVPTITVGDLELVSGMTNGIADIASEAVSCQSGIISARAAAWSKADQSDLYWYDMQKDPDGNWTFAIDLKNHKNNIGNYNVHMYAVDGNGFTRYAAGKTFDFSGLAGDMLVTVSSSDGTYTTEITGFSSAAGYKEIRVATWTAEGGQDDISWHSLKVSEEGDYASVTSSISDFKHYGTAYAHVYVVMADGSPLFLDGCEFSLKAPASGEVTAEPSEDGSFVLTLPGLESDLPVSEVRMAVWSAADQSNLYWYTAEKSDSDYVVSGSLLNHKNMSGTYYVHVYVYPENAPAVFVSGTTMKFEGTSGEILFKDNAQETGVSEETSYRLSISNVISPSGISKLQFAVWNTSDTGNIRWYTAAKDPDGTYYADVPISDFRKLGQYVTHVYITDASGNLSYLDGKIIMNVTGTVMGAAMEAGNDDTKNGTFDVIVSGAYAPSGIESMTFYAWTTQNQSDMHAYAGERQSDGSYKIRVNIANHNYNGGKFYIHAYAVMGNGISTFAAGAEHTFTPSQEAIISNEARRIIASAKTTPTTPPGYCAMWISNVYRNAGLPVPLGDARDMWARMSTPVSNIKPGMAVAVRHSGPTGDSWTYGHIGIYIGDGLVMDSTGRVNTRPLSTWIASYDYTGTVRCGYLL